jgi:hypothetical protein
VHSLREEFSDGPMQRRRNRHLLRTSLVRQQSSQLQTEDFADKPLFFRDSRPGNQRVRVRDPEGPQFPELSFPFYKRKKEIARL